jgi:hypothetical protein
MTKTTFIYALTCPDTGEVKYVGKADDPKSRLREHIAQCKSHHTHKSNWIKSLLSSGKRPGIVILEEVSFTEWQSAERRWIEYRRLSSGASLTNITDGGQGGSQKRKKTVSQFSFQLDPETKRQIAELAEWWGLSTTRNTTAVIRKLVTEAHARESARREMAAHDEAMKEREQ